MDENLPRCHAAGSAEPQQSPVSRRSPLTAIRIDTLLEIFADKKTPRPQTANQDRWLSCNDRRTDAETARVDGQAFVQTESAEK
jgi:hypothetical protein